MTKLYVAEFAEVEIGPAGRVGQFAAQPTLAEQVVDYTAGSAQSSPFNTNTRFVRLHTDAICSVVFGTTTPTLTAATTNARMAANQTEYFGVPKGQAFKVAAITNT